MDKLFLQINDSSILYKLYFYGYKIPTDAKSIEASANLYFLEFDWIFLFIKFI